MMNRKSLEVSTLQIFKTVAECGSITAAAEQLCYVQPNVTSRVQRLEQFLKTPLFHRNRRQMVLTQAGERLLRYADQILRLVDEACAAVAETSGEGGVLRIGSLESTAAARLPTILAELHRRHSQLRITVATGPTDSLVRDVLHYRLDGAFVGGNVDHPDLSCEPSFTENLVLVTERNYKPPTGQQDMTLLAFRHGCPYRIKAEMLFREMGWSPMRIMEFGTLDGILGCVSAGIGIAVLPRSVIDRSQYRKIVKFSHILPDLAKTQTMFIRRRDTSDVASLGWLLELVSPEKTRRIPRSTGKGRSSPG